MANPFYNPAFLAITDRMRPVEATLLKLEIYERARQNYHDALSGRRRDDPWPSLSSFVRAEVEREIEAAAASRPTPTVVAKPISPPPSRAEELEADGCHFAARAERRQREDMARTAQHYQHAALREAVEADVAKRDRVYDWLARLHGPEYADRWTDYYVDGPTLDRH